MSTSPLPAAEPRLLIATGNRHKIEEIRAILSAYPGELLDLGRFAPCAEPEENAPDYLGNAIVKATYYAGHTGLPALADDSGLEVDALDGRPGVLSARYGGHGLSAAGKIERLLAELRERPGAPRTARFRCAVALAWPSGALRTAEANCDGHIRDQVAPGDNGFGYDPVFVPEGFDLTFSQIPAETKNRLSHRARALAILFEQR